MPPKAAPAPKKLTEDDFTKMRTAMDKDGDDQVTKEEFKDAYRLIFPKTTDKEYDAIWSNIDANGDGNLDVKELGKYFGFEVGSSGGDDDGMTDEQILEALQMQTALAELEEQAKAKRENSPSQQKPAEARPNRRGSAGTVEARKKNSSGVQTVNMPKKTVFDITDPNILFMQACELGDEKEVQKRLNEGANPRIEDDKGEMPLHKLARLGLVAPIRLVLEKTGDQFKKDINWQNKEGKSAVFVAIEFKNKEVVTLLLDRGADPLMENNNGWTILHAAINANDLDLVSAILLHQYVIPVKRNLIEHVDRQGRTGLHIASFKGDEKIVKFLLDHNADAEAVDASGNSASSLAKKTGRRKSKELLDAHIMGAAA